MPDSQSGRSARTGQADEMFGGNVRDEQRRANEKPSDVAAGKKIILGGAFFPCEVQTNPEDQGKVDSDDDQIRRTFLDELGRDGATANFGAVYWERAGTVEVRRRSPIATRAGKILPFHLLKSDGVAAPNGLPRADG